MPLHPDADPQTKALPYIVAFLLIALLLFVAIYFAVNGGPPGTPPRGAYFLTGFS